MNKQIIFSIIHNSVGSNPVHGFGVRDFWRVRSSSKFKVFAKMFIVVGFGVRDIWRVRVGS